MDDDTRQSRLATASRLLDTASSMTRQGDFGSARRRLDEASMVLEAFPDDDDPKRLDVIANVCEGKGQIALMTGRVDEAYFQLTQGADLRRRQAATGQEAALIALAVDQLNLAATCRHMQRADEARRETEAAVATLDGVDDPAARALGVAARQSLGQIRVGAEDHPGAVALFERALEDARVLEETDAAALPTGIIAQLSIHLSLSRFALGAVEEALEAGLDAAEDAWQRLEAQLEAGKVPPGRSGGEALSQYIAAQMNLVAFNEALGRYAGAEDALFRVLNLVGPRPEVLARGRHFYQGLLALDDDQLEAGNLPRDEVEDSLAELEALVSEVSQA